MNINELQKRIVNFANQRAKLKNFEMTRELSYIHLTEELGEIARQLTNRHMRPELFDENNLKEEIIDVILESLILARTCNFDIEKEISNKIDFLFKKYNIQE